MRRMDNDWHRAVVELFIQAYNSFDIDGMAALLHPQCCFQNVCAGQVNASADGVAEFRELALRSAGLFSARRQRTTRYHEEGETISVDIDYEGVLRADLPTGPRAGDRLRLQGRSVYEVRDGLIYRLTDYS